MTTGIKPDLTCVPFSRKGLYFVLTVPLVVLMLWTFAYLWSHSPVLSLGYLLLYGLTCYFQAYLVVFCLTIGPVSATRQTCPAGKVHQIVLRRR